MMAMGSRLLNRPKHLNTAEEVRSSALVSAFLSSLVSSKVDLTMSQILGDECVCLYV